MDIVIKNIPVSVQVSDLMELCSQYGYFEKITIYVLNDAVQMTAFVRYMDDVDASKAVAGLHQMVVGGRKLHVERARVQRNF